MLAAARQRLTERRQYHRREEQRRREEVYDRLPRVEEIDRRLRGIMTELVGLALGYMLSGQSEAWALAGSFAGLGVSLLCLKWNEKRIAGRPEWTPHVEAVYKEKPQMDDLGCGGVQ